MTAPEPDHGLSQPNPTTTDGVVRRAREAELSTSGGDLWARDDAAEDIAAVMLAKLTRAKAEQVAHAILKKVKTKKPTANSRPTAPDIPLRTPTDREAFFKGYRKLTRCELEERISQIQQASVRYHFSDREWRTVDRMRAFPTFAEIKNVASHAAEAKQKLLQLRQDAAELERYLKEIDAAIETTSTVCQSAEYLIEESVPADPINFPTRETWCEQSP